MAGLYYFWDNVAQTGRELAMRGRVALNVWPPVFTSLLLKFSFNSQSLFSWRIVGVFESLFSIYWDGHLISVLESTYEYTTFIGFYMLGHFCISKWYLLMYSVLTSFVSAWHQLESFGRREPRLRTFPHWLAFTQTWVTSSWLIFDVGKPSPLRVVIQSWVL